MAAPARRPGPIGAAPAPSWRPLRASEHVGTPAYVQGYGGQALPLRFWRRPGKLSPSLTAAAHSCPTLLLHILLAQAKQIVGSTPGGKDGGWKPSSNERNKAMIEEARKFAQQLKLMHKDLNVLDKQIDCESRGSRGHARRASRSTLVVGVGRVWCPVWRGPQPPPFIGVHHQQDEAAVVVPPLLLLAATAPPQLVPSGHRCAY